ncbi:MAG: winged helix-turn-helix domain-containing protein, partial [Kangiellaceae bacterium]|nr:winged helix-turn-helix domain-containing protein [Kangiellaceae bacterium]
MSAQYWVGGFFIDLSRNQITQNKQSQTIAPKALAVLTYLAENQGKVVSQEAILAKVWQDTAVSPNTLQRSIAQLRKALGDDGKIHIKTHAKQGYSLECDVRWQDNVDSTSSESSNSYSTNTDTSFVNEDRIADENSIINEDSIANEGNIPHVSETHSAIDNESSSSGSISKLFSIIAGIFILGGIAYLFIELTSKQTSNLTFDQLRLLTATDDKEFDATYSPDGQYIIFHRYLDKQCINKIWAKNINTQQEILLTQNWGAYGRHSFSKDGKKMVFLATEPCNNPASQTYCYDLVSLDFEKALESPQQPSIMLQCKNTIVKKPIWYGDDNIALLKFHSNRWKLISYSVSENKSKPLYDIEDGNVIDFAYSTKQNLIAVTSLQNKGQ